MPPHNHERTTAIPSASPPPTYHTFLISTDPEPESYTRRIDPGSALPRMLSSLCPELSSLRLGGSFESSKAVMKALEAQLPTLEQQQRAPDVDDWEESVQNDSHVGHSISLCTTQL